MTFSSFLITFSTVLNMLILWHVLKIKDEMRKRS